ncbi:hypothetical protein NDU88_007990 [Pleurodeles waltl]|uniref:Uncharacterized protein n=1 Tax=Pleurodeles waltl TaxID=8319 RepID=A0AAV7PQV8_PLEWA|nr:hypothetical protein NDU88_007990 [Pleurodeles waltl]
MHEGPKSCSTVHTDLLYGRGDGGACKAGGIKRSVAGRLETSGGPVANHPMREHQAYGTVRGTLTTLFGAEAFAKILVVERANRALAKRPPLGAQPRPILAYLLNCRDRDTTLRLSCKCHPLQFDGNEISIYPDFMMAVQEARKKYTAVKQKLRQANVAYAMLYPACLKIKHKGKDILFTSPQQASDYMKWNNERESLGPRARSESETASALSAQD